MVRLSERETCRFVKLLRQHQCLWNRNHDYFKCKETKLAAREAIAREMNIEDMNATEVKEKMKSLKSTYMLELKKLKRFSECGKKYVVKIKWFSMMDSFLKNPPEENWSSENVQTTFESIVPGYDLWQQQSQTNLETTPSMPSESEIEQSIRSISSPGIITVIPEVQSIQSSLHSQVVTTIPETLTVTSVSNPEIITVMSDTPTVKCVVNPEVIRVTPSTPISKPVSNPIVRTETQIQQTAQSVSNHIVRSVPSGIHTVNSSTTPKYFALIPDNNSTSTSPKYFMITPKIQTSNCISSPELLGIPSGNDQNAKNISGSQVIINAPEMQQRVNQVSSDETPAPRKRSYEEVSSTNSNNDHYQNKDFNERCEDETDAFGRFVALNLKKMTMPSALAAQSEILLVVRRYRLKDSNSNSLSKQIPYITKSS